MQYQIIKIDAAKLKVEQLNNLAQRGWRPIHIFEHNHKLVVMMEHEGTRTDLHQVTVTQEIAEHYESEAETNPIAPKCFGTTTAGNPCKSYAIKDSEFCVTHQPKGRNDA